MQYNAIDLNFILRCKIQFFNKDDIPDLVTNSLYCIVTYHAEVVFNETLLIFFA